MGPLRCSRYVVFSPLFLTKSGLVRQIAFSTASGEWYVLDPDTASAVARSDTAALPRPLLRHLAEDRLLVPPEDDELRWVLNQNTAEQNTSDKYILTLMPTKFCQMGCTYCGQRHEPVPAPGHTRDAIIEFVRKQFMEHKYATMNVTWFGGEPLTAMPAIRDLTRRLRGLCAEARAQYGAAVITNGLLLSRDRVRELIVDLGIRRIQVTVDGPQAMHDVRRPLKSGAGTYRRIMENLREYARGPEYDVQLHLRVNLDPSNTSGVPDLLAEIGDSGIASRVSRIYVASVFEWGGATGRDQLSDASFAAVELSFMRGVLSLGVPVELVPARVTHACPTYYNDHSPLIDPDGVLHSCYEYPMARDSGEAPLGRSGTVSEGPNAAKAEHRRSLPVLLEARRNDPSDCYNCSMLPVCGGTCEPFRETGRRRCPGFKYNLGERLVLAYHQLEVTGDYRHAYAR